MSAQATMESSRYLRQSEVCRKLGGISRVTLWRLRRQDKFPKARQVGGTLLWSEAELEEFMVRQPQA